MKAKIVTIVMVGILTTITIVQNNQQAYADCVSPGGAPAGTDYNYVDAANTYQICLYDLSIQSISLTQTAAPTVAPTVTPTAIPTETITGCIPDGSNAYRNCVISDVNARADSHLAWWQPVIGFIVLITAFVFHR